MWLDGPCTTCVREESLEAEVEVYSIVLTELTVGPYMYTILVVGTCTTMRSTSLLLLYLLWSLVEVHSQTAPNLTFMGATLPNHALSLMMYPGGDDDTADTSSAVICHTDLTTCCRSEAAPDLGS